MLNTENLNKRRDTIKRYDAIKAEASQVDINNRAKFIKEKLDKEFSLDEMRFISEHVYRHV